MSTYQSASYWQFRIQGSIEHVLHNHQAVADDICIYIYSLLLITNYF